jgi:hypothetical protein
MGFKLDRIDGWMETICNGESKHNILALVGKANKRGRSKTKEKEKGRNKKKKRPAK